MQWLEPLQDITGLDLTLWHQGRLTGALVRHPVPPALDFSPEDRESLGQRLRETPDGACHAATRGSLEYVVVAAPAPAEPGSLLFLGPFLTFPVTLEFLHRLMADLKIGIADRVSLATFYQALPVVASRYPGALGRVVLAFLGYQGAAPMFPFLADPRHPEKTTPLGMLNHEAIERRYQVERDMRRAVASGDRELHAQILRTHRQHLHLADRVEGNPLRSAKNLGFVVNTLLRLSAGDGGLPPVVLHQISEKFAVALEAARTTGEVFALQDSMAAEYLDKVRQYRNQGLSPVTRRVRDHIRLHLSENLSLSTLAARFGLSPSHLANRFRRELGRTVSQQVNLIRVEEAKELLNSSDLAMKEVAALVGFRSDNYFSRIFQASEGVSPAAWRRNRPVFGGP